MLNFPYKLLSSGINSIKHARVILLLGVVSTGECQVEWPAEHNIPLFLFHSGLTHVDSTLGLPQRVVVLFSSGSK